MSKTIVNIKGVKFCAFCKYWWDPCCKYIAPHIGSQWYYESSAKCRCIKRSLDTSAFTTCDKFKLKLDI